MNEKYKLDPTGREYPNLHSHTVEVITEAGQARYNIPDADYLRKKRIIGLFIRQQNAGSTRKSKNGRALIANTTLDCGFLYLEVDAKRVLNDHPLSHFVHEPGSVAPGDYTQLLLEDGFDPSSSVIRFSDSTTVEDDKAVELTFIYALPKECPVYDAEN